MALAKHGQLLNLHEQTGGYTHAENLHVFIEEVLAAENLSPASLEAIAVSNGPGSYTGLRIGASAAKGLAYTLNIPLISIDTLKILSNAALKTVYPAHLLCPMVDARRMEVYTGIYNLNLEQKSPVEALVVTNESIQKFSSLDRVAFFGDGMNKCKELLSTLNNASFIEDIYPSAKYMCSLSYEKFSRNEFEDTAYFEPFYLKNFLIKSSNI